MPQVFVSRTGTVIAGVAEDCCQYQLDTVNHQLPPHSDAGVLQETQNIARRVPALGAGRPVAMNSWGPVAGWASGKKTSPKLDCISFVDAPLEP